MAEEVNRQKECDEFSPNTKGYCIHSTKSGYGAKCSKHKVCRCPYLWRWKDIKSCQKDPI